MDLLDLLDLLVYIPKTKLQAAATCLFAGHFATARPLQAFAP